MSELFAPLFLTSGIILLFFTSNHEDTFGLGLWDYILKSIYLIFLVILSVLQFNKIKLMLKEIKLLSTKGK